MQSVAEKIDQPTPDEVGRLARYSAKWVFGLLVARQIITLATTMVVSRLVTPADVGMVGMVSTFVAFMVLFDTGLTWATVQPKDLSRDQVDSMFWLGLLLGGFLWSVCIAAGPLLARFYHVRELSLITCVMGASVFFNSMTTQLSALLKRAMRQKANNTIDTVAIIVSCVVGISMALAHLGYWAIVAQAISVQPLRFLLLLQFSGYKPGGPRFSRSAFHLLKPGGLYAASNYICYIQLYIATILIGHVFGSESLGYYLKATALKALPTMYAAMVVTDVMVSSLAVFQGDPNRMGAAYRKALRAIAFVGCPAGALLLPLAPDVVHLLYGEQWKAAVPILRWLSLSAVALPVTTTTIWLFLAAGKAKDQLIMNIGLSIIAAIAYAIAILRLDTLIHYVILEVVLFTLIYPGISLIVSHKSVGLSLRDTLKTICPIILLSLLTAIFVAILNLLIKSETAWLAIFMIKSAAGCTFYIGTAAAIVRPFPIGIVEKKLSRFRAVVL